MTGEDALSTIGTILQNIGVLAKEKPKDVDLRTALESFSDDHARLREIQEKEYTWKIPPAVGLTKEAAEARLALRNCIIDVKKKLQVLLKRVQERGFEETGLGALQTFAPPKRKSTAERLWDCQRNLRAARTGAERCQAFNIEQRSWEKNLPPHFVPVRKLQEILTRLRDDEKQTVILHGMFGMGKSALALEVASTLSKGFDYPGGVHFLVFGQEFGPRSVIDEKICSELLHILEFLDKKELGKVDRSLAPSAKKKKIKEILETLVSKYRCLFVLDDVWNPEILRDFIVDRHLGNLLVTTRIKDRRFAEYRHSSFFDIQPSEYMDRGLDKEIFRLNAGMPPEIPAYLQPSARTIIGKCHGCPLALTVMGNAINGKTKSAEWQQAAKEFMLHARHSVSRDGYASTMFQGVESSIGIQLQFSATADLLEPISFFRAGTEIPKDIMNMAWAICSKADKFQADVEALTSVHLLEQREKLGEVLTRRNLHVQTLYWLHPIVSEYLFEDLQLKKRKLSLHDRQLLSLNSTISADNRIHLFCAFLLTYGHQVLALESAALLEELGLDIMEGDVQEVKALTSELRTLNDEQLPLLKNKVIAATLSAWGLAKVIQTGQTHGLSDLEQANRLQPDNAMTLRNMGVAHFILGNFEAALANLSSANELQPHDPLTLLFLNTARMGTSNWAYVQPEVEMIANSGTHDIFLSVQCLFKWKQGSLNGALRDLEACTNLNPYIVSILGAVKMELGDLTAAQTVLRDVLSKEDVAFTRCMQGLTSLQNGKYSAAKEDLDRALELEPNTPLFLSVRGEVNRMLEKYDAASDDLEQAMGLSQQPDDFTLRSLINVKWMQGKFEEAIYLANSRTATKLGAGNSAPS